MRSGSPTEEDIRSLREDIPGSSRDGGPPRGGEFILAMDPTRFGDNAWLDHTEKFFEKMIAIEGVRLPGARRYANREKAQSVGVQVPEELHAKIVELIEV